MITLLLSFNQTIAVLVALVVVAAIVLTKDA